MATHHGADDPTQRHPVLAASGAGGFLGCGGVALWQHSWLWGLIALVVMVSTASAAVALERLAGHGEGA